MTTEQPKLRGRKFPYQLEYCQNLDCIQLHARSRFPESDSMESCNLRFLSKRANQKGRGKRHPLYAALARIAGLKSASGGGYTLQLIKANDLFSWDELIPKILKVVQETVARNRLMIQVEKQK